MSINVSMMQFTIQRHLLRTSNKTNNLISHGINQTAFQLISKHLVTVISCLSLTHSQRHNMVYFLAFFPLLTQLRVYRLVFETNNQLYFTKVSVYSIQSSANHIYPVMYFSLFSHESTSICNHDDRDIPGLDILSCFPASCSILTITATKAWKCYFRQKFKHTSLHLQNSRFKIPYAVDTFNY